MTTPTDTTEFKRYLSQELLIESVTEKLLELMEREDVSKAELARRLGKSRAYITQILDGSRNMTLRTVADVAHAIGYDVHLAEGTGLGGETALATVSHDQIAQAPATPTAAQQANLGDEIESYLHFVSGALRGRHASAWQPRATATTGEHSHGRVFTWASTAADGRGKYFAEEVEVSA